ncbi:hypothetical protein [Gimesia aquarii]|uniref:Uncharacterized protein n=1 Tax=Gimesia aquarii TaxID=2527964 RepID=A0A517WT05_9PLAN|nr:hypothetical protein [Gimesia aquarii]QDU08380.1 hypothetical protein V202x_17480 [Gimesia aquarii]
MEWFAFLIYFLIAFFCTLVLWFMIKVCFRDTIPSEPKLPEPKEIDTIPLVAKERLYWNFSSVLIVILTLLLVLGISVRDLPLSHPVILTLGGALILIWMISLWSKMLSFWPPVLALLPDLPEFLLSDFSEFGELEPIPVPETTDKSENA